MSRQSHGLRALITIAVLALLSVGCDNATPTFTEAAPGRVPQPTFSGKTTISQSITSPEVTVAVTGECDPQISGLSARIIGHNNWSQVSDVATGGMDVDCRDKTFSFSIKSISALGTFSASEAQTLSLELRSETKVGPSLASQVKIYYTPPGKSAPPGFSITSGGGPSSSANYQMRSSIKHTESSALSSTNYKLIGGVSK